MRNNKLFILLGLLLVSVLLVVGCGGEDAATNDPANDPANEPSGEPSGEPAADPVSVEAATYVGSDSCAGCHSDKHEGWEQTMHPFMVQNVEKNPDAIADYTKALMDPELADWENSVYTTLGGDNDGVRLSSWDDVVYTVGSEWKQRALIRTEHGFNFVQFQANPEHVTAEGIVTEARLNEYGGGRQYEDRCLGCHTTGFDYDEMLANQDRRGDADYYFEDFVAELGVGCEACHGPASEHVSSPSADTILNPSNLSPQQELDFCGTCHARNNAQIDANGEPVGGHQDPIFYEWGDDLYDHKLVNSLARGENIFAIYDEDGNVDSYRDKEEGGSYRFWGKDADGNEATARSHRMQYNEMEMNPMKAGLDFTCSTCHDLHDPSTLKGGSWEALIVEDLGGQTCSNCHSADWDIEEAMPKNSMSANGVQDIRQHTFGGSSIGDVPEGTK